MLLRVLNWERAKALLRAGVCVAATAICYGCQTAHYYAQAIRGEYRILSHREPVRALLTDPQTSPQLNQQFELVLRLREFARTRLKLPIDKHYLTYVDLHRPYAVWNVHAAPLFSLAPKKWWYPVVGSLKYRGFFSEADADACAARLAKGGAEVYVEGVEAYSTLGFFADPLLNTFIGHPEPELAEIVFHELAHQRLFLGGDTDFNEAFATVVAEEGVHRWFQTGRNDSLYQKYLTGLRRNRQFVALVMDARSRLEALYGRGPRQRFSDASARSGPAWMRAEKAQIITELRQGYADLKRSWGGYSGYDDWFAGPLNNAQLNTIAVYYELVPGFKAILAGEGGDLERFYKDVRALHKLNKEQRHRYLLERGAKQASTLKRHFEIRPRHANLSHAPARETGLCAARLVGRIPRSGGSCLAPRLEQSQSEGGSLAQGSGAQYPTAPVVQA